MGHVSLQKKIELLHQIDVILAAKSDQTHAAVCGARTRIDEAIRDAARSKQMRTKRAPWPVVGGGDAVLTFTRGEETRRGGRVDDALCYHGDRAARKSRESDR